MLKLNYFAKFGIEMVDGKHGFSYCNIILQDKLPEARVVYCSATGASEPRNMGYMVRLGLWGDGTSFSDFREFLGSVLICSLLFLFLFLFVIFFIKYFVDKLTFALLLQYLLLQL
jgi:hypothetical protein